MNTIPDTIAACATAPGDAAIAIVRVSGPQSLAIADRIFRCAGPRPSQRPAQTFVHGFVFPPVDNNTPGNTMETTPSDEAILLIYRAPHSYTGEDAIELQGHGGSAAARRILRAVIAAGARPAENGEFTRRAFLNGKIDLVQAEAIADLIRATTDRAAELAVSQLRGSLSSSFENLYQELMTITSEVENLLDFSEEEIDKSFIINCLGKINKSKISAEKLLDSYDDGRLIRDGASVAICGIPNVGKSTLLNRLIGYDRAIVTHLPGTTRDTIEEYISINGIPIKLIDTAGVRSTECLIEKEGIDRAHEAINKADLVILIVDGSQPIDTYTASLLASLASQTSLLIINKQDLGAHPDWNDIPENLEKIAISLLKSVEVDTIKAALAKKLHIHAEQPSQSLISERHRQALIHVRKEIDRAIITIQEQQDAGLVLAASNLHAALDILGTITGRNYSDELLDMIFSRFCIGK